MTCTLSKPIALSCIFFLFACQSIPQDVQFALRNSGENKKELIRVIEHYKLRKDTLKVEAAYFLIANMIGKQHIVSREGEDFKNPYTLEDREEAKLYLQSHFSHGDSYENDLQILDAEYLITHIDNSVAIWQSTPWKNKIDFNDFCEYLLPYKVRSEHLEKWQHLKEIEYLEVLPGSDPIEHCINLNDKLIEKFDYSTISLETGYVQNLNDILESKKGSCDQLCTLATRVMRSNGIPSTMDYVPYWAHTYSGHSWNVALGSDKKMRHFGGADESIGSHSIGRKYKPFYREAKVYRNTYSIQKNTLPFHLSEKEKIPTLFNNISYKDVTEEYVEISNLIIPLKNIPEKTKHAYICIYNRNWTPIDWGTINRKNKSVNFSNMGRDILYIVMYYENHQLVPASSPFWLDSKGNITFYKIKDTKNKLKLTSYNRFENNVVQNIDSGSYQLYYWANKWERFGNEVFLDSVKHSEFQNVPENTIYKLEKNGLAKHRFRPFIIRDSAQVYF